MKTKMVKERKRMGEWSRGINNRPPEIEDGAKEGDGDGVEEDGVKEEDGDGERDEEGEEGG